MFEARLSEIRGRVAGARALSLVGRDGILVESVPEHPDIDLETLAAELITQVKAVSENHRELDVGDVEQVAVFTDRYTILMGALNSEYYLLLVLGETANYGRARFELRRARLLFDGQLD